MRLREVQAVLRQAIPGLQGFKQSQQPGSAVVCSGLNNLRESVSVLRSIEAFKPYCEAASQSAIFRSVDDVLHLSVEAFNNVATIVSQMLGLANGVFIAVNALGFKEQPSDTISIKLPPTSSIDELIRTLKILQQAFDRPAKELTGQGVSLDGVDSGSIWIDLLAHSNEALLVIGAMLTGVREYRRHRLETEYLAERTRSLQIANTALEDIKKSITKSLNQLAAAQADQVIKVAKSPSVRNKEALNELNNAISRSVIDLDRLIDKGLEIHKAIGASGELNKLLEKPMSADTLAPILLPARAASSEGEDDDGNKSDP